MLSWQQGICQLFWHVKQHVQVALSSRCLGLQTATNTGAGGAGDGGATTTGNVNGGENTGSVGGNGNGGTGVSSKNRNLLGREDRAPRQVSLYRHMWVLLAWHLFLLTHPSPTQLAVVIFHNDDGMLGLHAGSAHMRQALQTPSSLFCLLHHAELAARHMSAFLA